jgi:hypothetical protein
MRNFYPDSMQEGYTPFDCSDWPFNTKVATQLLIKLFAAAASDPAARRQHGPAKLVRCHPALTNHRQARECANGEARQHKQTTQEWGAEAPVDIRARGHSQISPHFPRKARTAFAELLEHPGPFSTLKHMPGVRS